MAIFPLIADKDSAAITLSAVSGNELPGSGLAPYDAYELQVSVNGVATGTAAPAYTATLKSKGVPVGLVMKIELTSLMRTKMTLLQRAWLFLGTTPQEQRSRRPWALKMMLFT